MIMNAASDNVNHPTIPAIDAFLTVQLFDSHFGFFSAG